MDRIGRGALLCCQALLSLVQCCAVTLLFVAVETGDDPKDVKARLKVWAQAVALASASRLGS